MCDYFFNQGMMGGGIFGTLMMLGILLVVLFIGYFLFKFLKDFNNPNRDALKNLSNRFANGEISKEEYEEIKKFL
ncbi:SHOCT domain-containing protein [Clostridium sp. B9]|uniref:SHOCT domain-containing protein n=1 Tax=Clostridium sp. B9 TaxID=3423224 RepID=UPI003D2F08D0